MIQLLIVVVATLVRPALAAPTAQVVGGHDATTFYPWMVGILLSSEKRPDAAHFCGGTLIAPDRVMTAAHCVFSHVDGLTGAKVPLLPALIDIWVGSSSFSDPAGRRLPIRGIVVHPEYDPRTLKNDIAILLLEEKLTDLPPVQLARVAQGSTWGIVLGWGSMSGAGYLQPSSLQEGVVMVPPAEACRQSLGGGFDEQRMICSGVTLANAEVNSCQGDSGGPVLQRQADGSLAQVGITSWASQTNCASSTFNAATAVSAYTDFLFGELYPLPLITGPVRILDRGDYVVCEAPPLISSEPTTLSWSWTNNESRTLASTAPTLSLRTVRRSSSVQCHIVVANQGGKVGGSSTVLTVDEHLFSLRPFFSQPRCRGSRCSITISLPSFVRGRSITLLRATVRDDRYTLKAVAVERLSVGSDAPRQSWRVRFRKRDTLQLRLVLHDSAGNTRKITRQLSPR